MKSIALRLIPLLVLFASLSPSIAQETPPPAPAGTEAAAAVEEAAAAEAPPEAESGALAKLDQGFGKVNGYIAKVLFAPVLTKTVGEKDFSLPLIIALLVAGGLGFTFFYRFVNVRLFKHAIACVRGRFDNPDDEGEISHFKALTSALSATVGLGNIAGVAVAIAAGGPGAVFWMWLVAFFGMSMKFSSCTLAQMYRKVDDDGTVMGGPMVYLERGFADLNVSLAGIGKALGILFAVLTIFASFGGGNMFQGNMTYAISEKVIGFEGSQTIKLTIGIVMAVLVGLVIIGGIRRIGEVTSKMVPAMCVFFCLVCLFIVLKNISTVPAMFGTIFSEAFNASAAFGGFLGVLVQGMKRAAFSNEAGLGSAAIAHAAAKTKEPVREGVVAMLGPFIDTICVCTMTALAILITGVNKGVSADANWVEGATMTADAFATIHPAFAYMLVVAVIVFAFSTMVSWSYYGERCSQYLFGKKGILPYRILFTIAVAFGPVMSLSNVLDFSDMLILSMAFPNILGMALLAPKVKALLTDYLARLKSGEMKSYEEG